MPTKKEIATSRLPVKPETQLNLKIFCAKNRFTFDEAINYLLEKNNAGKKNG